MLATRPAEFIEAENQLVAACEKAVSEGFTLVSDIYGVKRDVEDNTYKCHDHDKQVRVEGKPALCAVAAYLLGKRSCGFLGCDRTKDAADKLGVDEFWVIGFEIGFEGGTTFYQPSDEEFDGWEAGHRAYQRFKPGWAVKQVETF